LQNYVSDWSEKVVEHATIDDLFVGAISEARKQFKVKNPTLKIEEWNDISRFCHNNAPSNQLAYLLVQEEFATSTPVFPQH
jgi:hypothetical protein